jgi:cell division protein FtsW
MAVFMWIIGQAAVNIAVVVKLLPVIGVPLPYVSYGGSALVANLMAAGVVLAFARQEPGAREALRRRRRRRSLSVLARTPGGRS